LTIRTDDENEGDEKTILLFSTNKDFQTGDLSPRLTSFSDHTDAENSLNQVLINLFETNIDWFITNIESFDEFPEELSDNEDQEKEEQCDDDGDDEEPRSRSPSPVTVHSEDDDDLPKDWNKKKAALFRKFYEWLDGDQDGHQPILYVYNLTKDDLTCL